MKIIAYTYGAAMHCPACTSALAAIGRLKRVSRLRMGTDENGVALGLTDREGNAVCPVFDIDENESGESCDTCHEAII